ncbi:MAG TPA: histone deacetylase [Thermoanaerobaculia bacterium]|nr:histone deacetylase [Thermoanaerobaculia bacterium]
MLRIFTSRRCLAHRAPGGYPERPERLAAILDHLAASERFTASVVEDSPPGTDAVEAILAVHDERYVARLRRAVERGDGLVDSADNPLSPGTWEAALAAVEASLAAARWAAAGEGRHAFALVRPPGHHAERDRAMGFCFFNNVAVAAEHLRRSAPPLGAARVAIFDFDLHHGNGTQHLFEARADVFYASLHQAPFYPGTGLRDERGAGDGVGATFNLPLPAGTGDEEYLRAVDEEALPALAEFAPDFLAVSAGFDTWQGDPLGGFRLTEAAFRALGRRVRDLAGERCRGRSLSLLEGGYDLAALPRLVEAYLDGLAPAPLEPTEPTD